MKRILKLLLPVSIATVTLHAASAKTIKHTIKSGESLYTIAKKNHTTIATLCKLNGIKRSEVLKVGHTIKVPGSKAAHKSKKHIAKNKHKATGIKHRQKLAVKTPTKHKVKASKHHTQKAEKKLAKTLKYIRTQHVAKVNIKTPSKFSLSDIVFGNNGKLSAKSKRIIALAKQKLGKRYVWGATGQRNTFDCSGLTSYVCKANGIRLPRRAIQQSKVGKPVKRSDLKPGDLVFFDTSKHRKGYVNHVGIYIGNGKFIHASSAKKKVIITSLNKPFYSQRFKGARRVASL